VRRVDTQARERLAVAGAAGLAATLTAGAAVGFGRPWFVFAAVRWLFARTPDFLVRVGITEVGGAAQPAFALAVGVCSVGLLAATVPLGERLAERTDTPAATAGTVAVAQPLLVVVVGGTIPAAVAGGLAGGLVVVASTAGGATTENRRPVLRAIGTAGVAVGLGGAFARLSEGRDTDDAGDTADSTDVTANVENDDLERRLFEAASSRSLDVPDVEGLVSRDFYQVDINAADPRTRREEWELEVHGAVDEGRTVDFSGLVDHPTEYRFVSLRCVGETLNGQKLDTALWTGVPVAAVLSDVTLDDEVTHVAASAADGYTMDFPIEALDDAFLAFGMNGGPLPQGHGAPVRLLVPGHWGEINVKWITELEFLTEEIDGYWEKRGWHGTGPVHTVAKLHGVDTSGGRVVVGGHAYAGTRGLDRVEVSTDGGDSWETATLSAPLPRRVPTDADPEGVDLDDPADDAARMWRYEYTASEPHEVVVRAVEADGTVQPRADGEGDPFPSGATGWVSQTVDPDG
jgi:DMSO/TMAO reductase YedYZ molybdopterin-dependent catalytic subunit